MSLWLPRKQAPVPDQLVGLAVHLLTLHHCARATMKNVALSHGKRRFCSFSSGKHGPISLKTEMALDSARVRSGSVSFSIRVESFSGIDSSR
jgi:hypothetical protein